MSRDPDIHLEVTFRPIPHPHPGWGPDSGWWTLEQFDAGDIQPGRNFQALIIGCVCGGTASGFHNPQTCPRWHRHRVVKLAKAIARGSISWFLAGPAPAPRFGHNAQNPDDTCPLPRLRDALALLANPASGEVRHTGASRIQTGNGHVPHDIDTELRDAIKAGWAKRTKRVITLTDTGRSFLASLGTDPDTGKPIPTA